QTFAILHLGDHQLFGGVHPYNGEESFNRMVQELKEQFEKANIYECVFLIDKHFGAHNYSFWHLFRDVQRQVLHQVLNEKLVNVETLFKQVHTNNYQTMQALKQVNMALPNQLKNINDFVVNADLRKALEKEELDFRELEQAIREAENFPVELDVVTLEFLASQHFARLLKKLLQNPEDIETMDKVVHLQQLASQYTLDADLWEARNHAFLLRQQHYNPHLQKSKQGDPQAQQWLEHFSKLYTCLNMQL
ncbi:MAG: DUF3536 domain-containing protein, partial [Hymenobacteraceae bacterium]|nr:DUF3536 domain-containing protein [Hymenobacteraceae bacterium]MDX5513849.1 DUF3536 domain-containing protein [Hymenobacteraceae bacterium]